MNTNGELRKERCSIVTTTTPKDEKRTLSEVIQSETAETPPLLAWAEPDPKAVVLNSATGRRKDFTPLVPNKPNWPADLPLVEARLFWSKSAIHIVANDDGPGCRWVKIEESANGIMEVMRCVFPVLTLHDRRRFGLDGQGERLTAIEYWKEGRLIAWRLTNKEA